MPDPNKIPDFQSVLLPLLAFAGDGQEHSLRDAINHLAVDFKLTPELRGIKIPSGYAYLFDNRVGWARTHLIKAKLIESVRRSIFKITSRGLEELTKGHDRLTVSYLKRYPEYLAMFTQSPGSQETVSEVQTPEPSETQTPDELFGQAYNQLRNQLANDILDRLKQFSTEPSRFEKLVLELLQKMGYGSEIEGSAQVTQRARDAGIDGIIKEDQLGLEKIYVQAKCWVEGTVGRREVQHFAGALDDRHGGTNKGVFITTARFTAEAKKFAEGETSKKIVLIDGEQLARYMIDFNLGVSTKKTLEIKDLDTDYFESV